MSDITKGSVFDLLQFEAWHGLMSYLLKQDEIRTQFEQETGTPAYRPPSAIEMLIDKAIGHDHGLDYVAKFVAWATPSHWGGESEITPSIREILDRTPVMPA